jgi:hypothetical protein
MIVFCGSCGSECGYEVEYDTRNRPVDVTSDCCGESVYYDPGLCREMTAMDVVVEEMFERV